MSQPMDWSTALACCQHEGLAHVLLSLISCTGSTPREPGAKMVVTSEAQYDTLGGGRFEEQLIAHARKLLSEGKPATRVERFALGVQAQQCCGGHVAVLLECFPGAPMHIALFGAGHVGIALEHLVRTLPWRLDWYDPREEARQSALQDHGPRTRVIPEYTTDITETVASNAHCIVMTHDHSEDEHLIEYLLKRDDLASIGLIGSDTKWARFRHRLARKGFSHGQLESVRCPIGTAAHGKKRPEEIALAVAAELLAMAPDTRSSLRLRGLSPADLKILSVQDDV